MIQLSIVRNQTKPRLYFYTLMLFFISFSSVLLAQKADFYANITEGCESLSVQFTDNSEGATSWEWDLGNGNISTLQNPMANYTKPGIYTIKLTINGNTSAKKTDYIIVHDVPKPDFSSDQTKGCVPLQVQFEDKTIPANGKIEKWVWLINGVSISEKEPNFTFNEPGSYKITLMTIDENGCHNRVSKSKFITVSQVPNVDFKITGDIPCQLPYTPLIKNTTTVDGVDEPFVYINQWEWKINDQVVSTNTELDYTFEKNGHYNISLSAKMGECVDSLRVEDAITLAVDDLDITIKQEGPALTDNISFSINNKNVSYVEWDLGDGYKTNERQFKYCYADSGDYEVSITAILNNGCNLHRTQKVNILPSPIANFTMKKQNVCEPPFVVKFTNTSKMSEKVLWDFGDGNTSNSDTTVYHTFNSSGEFNVNLISYGKGNPDTLTKKLELHPPGGLPIMASQTEGCIPLDVQFNTGATLKNVHWDFGNGEESSLQAPKHTFTKEGVHNVKLSYTNAQNCQVTSTINIRCGNKPIANFTVSQTDSCNRSPIELTNLSSNYQTEEWVLDDFFNIDQSGKIDNLHFLSPGYKPVELMLDNYGCKASLRKEDKIYIKPPVAFFYLEHPLCEVPARCYIDNYSQQYDEIFWNFGDGQHATNTPTYHTYENTGPYKAYQTVVNHSTGCKDYDTDFVHVSVTEPDFEVKGINEGCLPFSVSFIDKSVTTGELYKWHWNFGDGTSETTYTGEVTHEYTTSGVFDVKLTVEEFHGCRETIIKEKAIIVNYVDAKIGYTKDVICVNETFEVNDKSQSNSNIVARNWLFEPGKNETSEVAQHTYSFPGDQETILFVTDENGCTNSDTLKIDVPVAEAIFISGEYACTNSELDVQNISLGENLSYSWKFGEGGTSAQKDPQYIYKNDGIYDISLEVTNGHGCSDITTKSIKAVTPVVDFEAYKTDLGCARNALPAVFFDHSSDDVYKWEWDFGDGEGSISQSKDPQYLYSLPGDYDVKLTVTSKGGCKREFVKEDYIHLTGPVGSISTNINAGCVPLTVEYSTNTDIENHISWDVGDGTNTYENQVNFKHTYNESRSFFPSIILTDKDGCKLEYEGDPIFVDNYPELDFTASNTNVCEGTPITFDSNILIASGDISEISEIIWDFGDSRQSSNSENPTYTYLSPGVYDVELHIKTSLGCSATLKKEKYITVFASTLDASITASKQKACLGESILFTNDSKSDYPIVQQLWDFNNGYSSSVSPLNYTYSEGGSFTTKLKVIDQQGCIDSTSIPIQISNIDASFTVEPVSGYNPLNAEFKEQASSDFELVSWIWDFGDNTTSDKQNPKHTFTDDSGQTAFNVSLTVTDNNKCSATAKDTVHAVNYPPVASNDTIIIQEDNAAYGNLSTNDFEPDGQQLIYSSTPSVDPEHGNVSIHSDGSFVYTPNTNYFGDDVFEYQVCDNGIPKECSIAKVHIEVLSVDDLPPVAMPDKFNVNERETLAGTSILLNDIDNEGMGLNVQNNDPISKAIHGDIVLNTDGTFNYTPDNNYIGLDSVMYIINDNGIPSESDSSWIIIDVMQVEEPPVAVSDTFNIIEDTQGILSNMTNNDSDPENNIDNSSVNILGSVNHGRITIINDEFVFTPEKDFNGTTSFLYSVSDMTFLSDTASIVVNVIPANDPPTAVNDSFTGFEQRPMKLNVIQNDSDIDGNLSNTIEIIATPLHGNCNTPDQGIFTYSPNSDFFGNDSIQYKVFDSDGLSSSAWVYIDIEKNNPPVAMDDHATGYEDVPLEISILSNDTDIDNNLNVSTFKLLNADVSNNFTYDDQSGILTYYSVENYIGPDILSYEICDSLLLCSQAKIYIELLKSFDDAPITKPDTVTVIQMFNVTADVAANDSDPDNDLHKESVYVVSGPESLAEVSILEDGKIYLDYSTDPGYTGKDSLIYQICDSANHCTDGKLNIIVKPYRAAIFIPQAITPNKDGKNDLFEITHIEKFPANRLFVYNRWGHEVYSTEGYNNEWDGTSNNKPLPDGTYYYVLYLVDGDDPIKGFVYISR